MKKIFLSVVAITAMLTLLSGCNEKKQEQKPAPQFGVVQISKLFQDSRIGKAGFERLSELEKQAQAELKQSLDAMEKARAEEKADELARIERNVQERVAYMQEVIRQDQEHVGNVIQTVMKNVFDNYSKENALFGIFSAENMLSITPEADVTGKILVLIDQVEPAFGDMPSFEMPKLPEPANALPLEGAESAPAEGSAAKQ
jgi:Skp family chaperone for outer membrane proteins